LTHDSHRELFFRFPALHPAVAMEIELELAWLRVLVLAQLASARQAALSQNHRKQRLNSPLPPNPPILPPDSLRTLGD
jgi:hypothetical protein